MFIFLSNSLGEIQSPALVRGQSNWGSMHWLCKGTGEGKFTLPSLKLMTTPCHSSSLPSCSHLCLCNAWLGMQLQSLQVVYKGESWFGCPVCAVYNFPCFSLVKYLSRGKKFFILLKRLKKYSKEGHFSDCTTGDATGVVIA